MARPKKPARLWYREPRKDGNSIRAGTWIILDSGKQVETGCYGRESEPEAEKKFGEYLAAKGVTDVVKQSRRRPPHQVPIAEVLARYMSVKKAKIADPPALGARVTSLLEWWGARTVDDVDSTTCSAYVDSRTGVPWKSSRPEKTGVPPRLTTEAAGRRELEDLRAAIRLAYKDRILTEEVHVPLPDENPGREVWLTEHEVETLRRLARDTPEMQTRHRGPDKGKVMATGKRPLAHVDRFICVGVQTGTRASAVCQASFEKEEGRPWIDLDSGLYYRRAPGSAEGKTKRYPTIPLSPDLVEEMRSWRDAGARYVVELDGKPVANCRKAFERLVSLAKFDKHVVRHTLRHTAATWMMQDGVDINEAAGYLGMTVETLQRRYGHHHPDYQRRAAASLSKRANSARANVSANVSPMKPPGNTGISEERRAR